MSVFFVSVQPLWLVIPMYYKNSEKSAGRPLEKPILLVLQEHPSLQIDCVTACG